MVKPRGQTQDERAMEVLEAGQASDTAEATADADSRARILAAAHQLFLERGTARATTQAVAARAGVNKALIHYYFTSKEALAREVFLTAHAQLWPQLFGILGDPDLALADKIRRVVRVQIAFIRQRPYLPGYVISELKVNPDHLVEVMRRRGRPPLAVVQAQLDAGARDGTLRPIRAEQLIITLIAAILFPFAVRPVLEAMRVVGDGGFEAFLDERERALPDLLIAGLQP